MSSPGRVDNFQRDSISSQANPRTACGLCNNVIPFSVKERNYKHFSRAILISVKWPVAYSYSPLISVYCFIVDEPVHNQQSKQIKDQPLVTDLFNHHHSWLAENSSGDQSILLSIPTSNSLNISHLVNRHVMSFFAYKCYFFPVTLVWTFFIFICFLYQFFVSLYPFSVSLYPFYVSLYPFFVSVYPFSCRCIYFCVVVPIFCVIVPIFYVIIFGLTVIKLHLSSQDMYFTIIVINRLCYNSYQIVTQLMK